MKLIISGATGFVATELIRQGLKISEITSLVVLSRRPITVPEGPESAKLKQVIIKDYGDYPEEVRKEFAGANACIWTVAITPTKSLSYKFEDVKRICQTNTIAGLTAMHESGPARPFRFVYTSGDGVKREWSEPPKPAAFAPYVKMRGETESQVLEFAQKHPGEVEACIVRPGLITSHASVFRSIWGTALRSLNVAPNVSVQELAASTLQQAVHGFTKETWSNEELKAFGAEILQAASTK